MKLGARGLKTPYEAKWRSKVRVALVLQTKCPICNLFAKKALMKYNEVELEKGLL